MRIIFMILFEESLRKSVKVLSPCLPAVTAGNIMVFIPDTGFVKKLESLLAVVVCDI